MAKKTFEELYQELLKEHHTLKASKDRISDRNSDLTRTVKTLSRLLIREEAHKDGQKEEFMRCLLDNKAKITNLEAANRHLKEHKLTPSVNKSAEKYSGPRELTKEELSNKVKYLAEKSIELMSKRGTLSHVRELTERNRDLMEENDKLLLEISDLKGKVKDNA